MAKGKFPKGSFPGWRHMSATERYNAKSAAFWTRARELERKQRAEGKDRSQWNLGLLPPEGWETYPA